MQKKWPALKDRFDSLSADRPAWMQQGFRV
jgi:hypothetical protein